MGFANSGCYKWIPKVAFQSIAIVSGIVGAFGAAGGFVYPSFILSPISIIGGRACIFIIYMNLITL